ncbi:dephospho-CoA kinase [Helicobacter sp. 11S02596-1]|uniref:dephospho-CoA kinase n=1 Tax=Helicobacter sp. 11S02596-1 TaxID=1476194 RepID=UPI000BA75811|nr:dephospho-CoA kinase [Helicobacter sp. 11S02596-1]PAF44241.1 dephospho-CoA kinase [Helicobacter sp. 11S02596-1]
MDLQYAIALTGGISSGKSTVASLLSLYGYCVVDADKIAHELLETNKERLIELFSSEILDTFGKIDRKKLGKIVFESKHARKILEDLLHPQIRQKILETARALENHHKFYFLDIPLFFEVGGREVYGVSKVLLVYAPQNIQLERLMGRDGLSKEEALQRICAQMAIEDKKTQSDFVIANTKDIKALQKEVEDFLQRLS